MPRKKAPLLLCALVLSACASTAPLSVIALTPEGPFEWSRGRAMLHQETAQGVRFWAAFERDRGEHLEWWVRIENHSQETLPVSTDYFTYRVAETDRGGHSFRAVDPTRAIAELDAARAELDVRVAELQRDESLLERLFEGILDSRSPSERRRDHKLQLATYLAERNANERWRDVLANQTVRRGVLRPGESVEGLVMFPRLEHAGRTELVLIVGPAMARFAYGKVSAETAGAPLLE